MKKIFFPIVLIIAALVACFGLQSLLMPLSDTLIQQAWNESIHKQRQVKPWPWMDSVPVGALELPGRKEPLVVMAGPAPAVSAYAPIWHTGSPKPGEPGISVIFGDRSAHFPFLREAREGTTFSLQTAKGMHKHYRISDIRILEGDTIDVSPAGEASVIVLSTDYPVTNGEAGEAVRFVAIARELSLEDQRLAGL